MGASVGTGQAKELALTGRALSGKEAADINLINKAVPFAELQQETRKLATQLASIPMSQLAAMKLIVNQAYENMGLQSTQLLGSVMDSMLRNTPEALNFIKVAEERGVAAAVAQRDGPFGDYSQAPRSQKPDPHHIVYAGKKLSAAN